MDESTRQIVDQLNAIKSELAGISSMVFLIMCLQWCK